jgi:hypothetical protein
VFSIHWAHKDIYCDPSAGLAMFHPGTFHGTFQPVSIGIR